MAQALYRGTTYKFKVIVIKGGNGTNLLSRQVVIKMRLITRIDEIDLHNNSGRLSNGHPEGNGYTILPTNSP